MACQQDKPRGTSSVFSSQEDADTSTLNYDLPDIEEAGELIVITISGPDTYFEFRGRGFGPQYDLAEAFARHLGVRLRVEVAHDTAEVLRRLGDGEADLAALQLPAYKGMTRLVNHWLVNRSAPQLAQAVNEWYSPDLLAELSKSHQEKTVVRRRPRPVMLDAAKGQICQYDELLQRHAQTIGWDWRLLAAQCYQESAFDPQAVSWAGAQGLMQIMPATASMLGVDGKDVFDPATNIEASVRLLQKLNQTFSDIRPQSARIPYILAAYNGGTGHVRDAMALARKYGRGDKTWRDVEPYILHLSAPRYYNDPVVTSGYLRGTETHGYVRSIMDRWMQYRGEARSASNASTPAPAKHPRNKIEVTRPELP